MFFWSANQGIRYTLAFIMLCIFSDLRAQSWNAYVQTGFATYNYEELKQYQEAIKNQSVDGATITDEFEPYYTYSVGIEHQFRKWSLGVEFGHGSSGGRVYYEDYSGKLIADQLVRYNYIGVTPNYFFVSNAKMQVEGGVKISYVMNLLGIRNSLTIGNQTVQEKANFKANSIAFQPNVCMKRYFGTIFFVRVSTGFEFQSSGVTKMEENSDVYLADENGDPVHVKGDGVRLTLGVGVKF